MSKNKVTAILFGFMGCLVLTIIILVIRLSLRPDVPVTEALPDESEVVFQEGVVPTPEVTEPEEPQTQIVVKQYVRSRDADTNVNVRSEPSTSGSLLGKMTYDTPFAYIEAANDEWTKIDYNGMEAYVNTSYIEIVEVEEEVPIESTDNAEDADAVDDAAGTEDDQAAE